MLKVSPLDLEISWNVKPDNAEGWKINYLWNKEALLTIFYSTLTMYNKTSDTQRLQDLNNLICSKQSDTHLSHLKYWDFLNIFF